VDRWDYMHFFFKVMYVYVKLWVKISQFMFVCVLVVVEKALTQAKDGSPEQFKEGRLDLYSYYSKRFVQVSPLFCICFPIIQHIVKVINLFHECSCTYPSL